MPYKDPEARRQYQKRRAASMKPPGVDRLPIARGKAAHVALLYLRCRRGPVMPDELAMFNPKMFSRELNRTLLKLVNNDLAVKNTDGSYTITKHGVNIVYHMATLQR